MPIFEIHCRQCGHRGELLVLTAADPLACPSCKSPEVEKLMSPTSPLTGGARHAIPGPRDHGCCGSRPYEAAGCAGPGSCCGRAPK
jgi:putative FmdB family regulatory protein